MESIRVAVFATEFPSTSETFIVRQIEGLARRGCEIDVYAQVDKTADVVFPKSFCSIDLQSVCRASKGYRFNSRFRRIGWLIKTFVSSPSLLLRAVFRLDRGARWRFRAVFESDSIRKVDYDVLLGQFGPNSLRALGLKEMGLLKGDIVAHFHGCDVTSLLKHSWYRRSLPLLFRRASAVIAVSNWMKSRLLELGCPESKILVIPCGASLEQIYRSNNVGGERCDFLSVGRVADEKGPLYTLQAFREHLKTNPSSTLTIIGDGHLMIVVRRFVEENRLGKQVKMLGAQPINVVHEYLARSSVFLQHSIQTEDGWIEGWGVSIAEAAGAGIPIVATRTGGIPDHVIDGITGLLVEQKDWRGMALAMNRLARDPNLRLSMGSAGRVNIYKVGNADLQICKLFDLTKSLCTTKREGA